jgi:protein-S-isoprenylcysteine O-methyltransferase Ste14
MMTIAGSALFLVIAPGFIAGLVPWWICVWRVQAQWPMLQLFRFAGGILIGLGAVGLLDSFLRFALQGLGTPAPVFPPRHLVVTGLYRYVRNPMYVAVLSAIVGQALLFASWRLLAYSAIVWLLSTLFVLLYEERTLQSSFGSEYEIYCRHVRRWIPRLRAWSGHSDK